MTHVYTGIDISKARLDVFDPRIDRATEHANTAAGIKALFKACQPQDILVFEATSGCDLALIAACAKAGRPDVRLDPLHAWHVAQSLNLPKTDRVDARMLARFGAERRDQLKRMETQEKNRLSKMRNPAIRTDILASLKALAARICPQRRTGNPDHAGF